MITRSDAHLRLIKAFPELHKASLEPLSAAIASLSSGGQGKLHKRHFLNTEAFDYLTAFLLTHHAMSQRPLKKENFEHAIEYIFKRQGRQVPASNDPTRRGADIMIDGVSYSLKTHSTSGKEKPTTFDISKFAESRWLREPLQRENFSEILRLTIASIRTHLAEYDEILLLTNHTATVSKGTETIYGLYRVPKSIFELTYALTPAKLCQMYFQEKARRSATARPTPQTVTAPLSSGGETLAKISLDGSVEKLRFLSVSISACDLQAEWKIKQ
jgi:hypothetical protein